jgi:hypothetical protein
MKRLFVALAALLAAAAVIAAPPPWYHSGLAGIAVGPVSTAVAFTDNHSGGAATALKARWVQVRATGASDTCYVDWSDGIATTDDQAIVASETYVWTMPSGYSPSNGLDSIGVICAGTNAYKTATYTDANLPQATDTLVVTDGTTPKTYTYVAAVAVEGDILIGTADETALHLVQALNGTGGTNAVAGDYFVAAANPLMSATQDVTGAGTGTITFTARVKGTAPAAWAGNETSIGAAFFASFTLNTGGGTQDDAVWHIEATR